LPAPPTPAGIGHAREPRLYMRPGDVCEVEIEGIGLLRNRIEARAPVPTPHHPAHTEETPA
jgi:acylpyruvate hydrolase